jgi:opine dehydrogenase
MRKFAVLGAGAGGRAAAGDFTFKGCKVNLYNRSRRRIEVIMKKGGVHVSAAPGSGVRQGFAKLNKISANIADVLEEDVECIFVLTTANGHRSLAEACAPYLHEEQVIFFAPGYGGALECAQVFKDKKIEGVTIAESLSLFYACRAVGPAEVRVSRRIGPNLRASAFPSEKTLNVISQLKNLVSLIPAKNVLETTLMNLNPVIHPIPTILNIGQVESKPRAYEKAAYKVYYPYP